MTIQIESDTSVNLAPIVLRTGVKYSTNHGFKHIAPLSRNEAEKLLFNLATFQKDPNARALFSALHETFTRHA